MCARCHIQAIRLVLVLAGSTVSEGALNMADKDNAPPRAALMVWHRAWPLAGLAIALLANAAWIGLLTYGLVKLL
jgi:hypothetical protein